MPTSLRNIFKRFSLYVLYFSFLFFFFFSFLSRKARKIRLPSTVFREGDRDERNENGKARDENERYDRGVLIDYAKTASVGNNVIG